jgi:hypothetical protein
MAQAPWPSETSSREPPVTWPSGQLLLFLDNRFRDALNKLDSPDPDLQARVMDTVVLDRKELSASRRASLTASVNEAYRALYSARRVIQELKAEAAQMALIEEPGAEEDGSDDGSTEEEEEEEKDEGIATKE